MINYKQLYKDEVIVTIECNDGVNQYDSKLTNNKIFYAVGSKTSNDLSQVSRVQRVALWCVKPDAVINFKGGGIFRVFDDDGQLTNINYDSLQNAQGTRIRQEVNNLRFNNNDSNIRFTNSTTKPLTLDINNLDDKSNVAEFNANVTVPSDVNCNYNTGTHKFINGQPVNILFSGDIKTGDTITIKRNGKSDLNTEINFDTDLAFSNLGMNNVNNMEIIYKHIKEETPTPKPEPPETPKPEPQTKYKLIPTLQNAKIIIPEPTIDKYGDTVYYLDPQHTTITIQANDGYTFESDGKLTYEIDDMGDPGELTIKASHTNTVTFNLPTDINWDYQGNFLLTMGAVKSEIVEATGGFTNIYKADYTNLLKFSNEVIIKTVGGSSGNFQAYDVTPYINNLVLLPFDVPSGDKSNIVAGNEIFKTQLPTVDNNYLNVNLGNITVSETYKNGYDYYNVKTRLMLPYTNMIELDPVHVINQTVSIKYIVNVVNGDTTINLFNGDDLFYSEQVNLASEVPFISNARKGTQYAVINRLKTVFRNSINQAYIIIEQPTPILNSEYYPTNEKGTLKGYNGNVKCTLLNNININANELNALQNLLNNGVNIK